jgi:hypothetical protein
MEAFGAIFISYYLRDMACIFVGCKKRVNIAKQAYTDHHEGLGMDGKVMGDEGISGEVAGIGEDVGVDIGVGELTSVNGSGGIEDGRKEDSREEVGKGLVSLHMEMSLPSGWEFHTVWQ